MDLAMTEVLIPSDMGLPIVIETHMPVVFSLNGKLVMHNYMPFESQRPCNANEIISEP